MWTEGRTDSCCVDRGLDKTLLCGQRVGHDFAVWTEGRTDACNAVLDSLFLCGQRVGESLSVWTGLDRPLMCGQC